MILLLVMLLAASTAAAQHKIYFGAAVGISTLSADGSSIVTPESVAISQYKPENGPTLRMFAGWHLSDYLSVEAGYGWNRNSLTLTSLREGSVYEQERSSSQHSGVGELLLYFRNRASWVRPYLSVGSGVVHLESSEKSLLVLRGSMALPPSRFDNTSLALRVAVGIDLTIANGWAFRYLFSETITRNPVSTQLSPQGTRNMANFQSLFGLMKSF